MPGRLTEAARRLRFAAIHRPYTLILSVILPVPGIAALIYGDATSKAFETLSSGILSRVMGLCLLLGGVITLCGIMRGKSVWEAAGLTTLAAGCLVYGSGVLLGLGLGGLVAGCGFVAIAVGSTLRVVSLAMAAHQLTEPAKQRPPP